MISVYIRCDILSPSSYYRVLQFTRVMKTEIRMNQLFPFLYYNFYLNSKKKWYFPLIQILFFLVGYVRTIFFVFRDCMNTPDYIIVSREMMPRYLLFPLGCLLRFLFKHSILIWDFDDHILLGKEISQTEFAILSKYSKTIIVTNDYLRNTISRKYQSKVILMPTTDGDLWHYNIESVIDNRIERMNFQIQIIWVATAANLPHLICVIPTLEETAKYFLATYRKQLVLNVVSSSFPECACKYLKINRIFWSRQTAIDEMIKAHIGIMPLNDNAYTKGKGGFKLIQYMSVGLPVIASNVGFNREVVDDSLGFWVDDIHSTSEWKRAIFSIIANDSTYRKYSNAAYDKWIQSFSYEENLQKWCMLLNVDYNSLKI